MTILACIPGNHRHVITLDGEALSHITPDPTPAQSGVRFTASGIVEKDEGGVFTQIDSPDWEGSPGLSGGDFEVRLTNNSGTPPSGPTLGSWHRLSSPRHWFISQSGIGSKSSNNTAEIRRRLTTEVIARATYTMSAQVTA